MSGKEKKDNAFVKGLRVEMTEGKTLSEALQAALEGSTEEDIKPFQEAAAKIQKEEAKKKER